MLEFVKRRKYEVLLFALISHLYNGAFLADHSVYLRVVWPINMMILGVACIGIFADKSLLMRRLRTVLFVLVMAIPLLMPMGDVSWFLNASAICYILFFLFIFYEILRFLILPSYINSDIISAAGCGFFLLIEVGIFISLMIYNNVPDAYSGIEQRDSVAHVFLDLVYFNSITLTSIGYGDIAPLVHSSRLTAAFIGVLGQFYSVVLVGIIISKYTSQMNQ